MTPEERAEDCFNAGTDPWKYGSQYVPNDLRERIADAIREAEAAAEARERERCAKIAEEVGGRHCHEDGSAATAVDAIVAAIRATGTDAATHDLGGES